MKILFKEPNRPFEVKEIENNLETLQQLVGGYIEVVPYKDNIVIICDEEGKLKGKEINISFSYDVIAGNCLFVGTNEGDFTSLTDKQIEEIIEEI